MAVKQIPGKNKSGRNAKRSTSHLPDFKAFLKNQQESGKKAPLFYTLMGLEEMSTQKLREQVENGLEYRRLERFQETANLTNQRVADLIQVPHSTLVRRRQKGRLDPATSDRLVRVSRIMGQVIELFEGDLEAAHRWLETPNPALDGEAPLDVLKTDIGGRMVEELILRLEYGVYT